MARRVLVLLPMALVVMAFVGCDLRRPTLRSSDSLESKPFKSASSAIDPVAVEADTSKILAVDGDPKKPRSFFSNNRKSGGWSSEAREVESHLGVGP